MPAVTVTFTNKVAARQDPGKPITTGWGNDIWDNATFLKEWLGAGYVAGAVQNHNHDGVNSAPVNIYPQLIPNASFEDVDDASAVIGWTHTEYIDGTIAVTTAINAHGQRSLSFTSTVLANGGGESIQDEFKAIAGGNYYSYEIYYQASVANVSSRVQIIWYDKDQVQISTTDIVNTASTPTGSTVVRNRVAAPATARFMKIKVIGGVPATGTAIGTIYFDGFEMDRSRYATDHVPNSITALEIAVNAVGQLELDASSVGQGQLRTTSGTVGGLISKESGAPYSVSGGAYGMGKYTYSTLASSSIFTFPYIPASNSSYQTRVYIYNGHVFTSATSYFKTYYITSSRPYDMGDGGIGRFIFAEVDVNGGVIQFYESTDAPWHYNGPTNIKADRYDKHGKGYRKRKDMSSFPLTLTEAEKQGSQAEYWAAFHAADITYEEITQEIKNADMPLLPHPFGKSMGGTIVLLDPVSDLAWQLDAMMQHEGFDIATELMAGRFKIGQPGEIVRAGPPGVEVVPFKLK